MRVLLGFCVSMLCLTPTLKADGSGDHPMQLKEQREGQYDVLVQRTKMNATIKLPQLADTANVEKAWMVFTPWFNPDVNPDMLDVQVELNDMRALKATKLDRDEVDGYAHTVYLLDVTDLIKEGHQELVYSYQNPNYYDDDALVILYEDQVNLPFRELYLFFGSESLKGGATSSMKFNRTLPGDAFGKLRLFMTADDDDQNSTLTVNSVKVAGPGDIFGDAQRGANPTADFSITLTHGPQEVSITTDDWLSLDVAVISLEPPVF